MVSDAFPAIWKPGLHQAFIACFIRFSQLCIEKGTLNRVQASDSKRVGDEMDFEWDNSKADSNLRKHGVAFAEAASAFYDPLATIFSDPDHSVDETREILVGYSEKNRLLIVSFTERDKNIRLISARIASAGERRNHENHIRKR